MVLTLVVCKILFPGESFDVKFPLGDRICDTKESHFHCPGTLPFEGIVGYANGRGIVAIDGSGGLRVAHFFEFKLKGSSLFAIEEEGAKFGFHCRGDDKAQNCT